MKRAQKEGVPNSLPLCSRAQQVPGLIFLCIAGALLNNFFYWFFVLKAGIPLYLDTALTIALTFYGGAFWGVLTGVFTNLILHSVWFEGWGNYLFIICNAAVAMITALFIRLFPVELGYLPVHREALPEGLPLLRSQRIKNIMDSGIVLIILSFVLCAAISLLGGIVAACIKVFAVSSNGGFGPELFFAPFLSRKNLPVFIVEALSRIPLNIIDRIVTVAGGYGIACIISFFRDSVFRYGKGR
ncbi:putative membrane protein [Treponema primitia ZAS-2]|uniref:Putative membrane protein n=1 Tax=Treponema primitia (strain ATCC BAA-887 / DSM 12427 / ZAS-2) TaxID=545694 RepID=F5YH24_TREPZ|nr:hypothetical protein [Treponema primitia]AEF84443.1 putative membrane protein [Treponema primitia ZAS-2]